MFRYVKTINNSIYSMEPVYIKSANLEEYYPGCCVCVERGYAFLPETGMKPTHISVGSTESLKFGMIQCFAIKRDMLFKVEYVGSITPTAGSKVGLSFYHSRYDAVTHDPNGCATIQAVCENPKYVYVTFNI